MRARDRGVLLFNRIPREARESLISLSGAAAGKGQGSSTWAKDRDDEDYDDDDNDDHEDDDEDDVLWMKQLGHHTKTRK